MCRWPDTFLVEKSVLGILWGDGDNLTISLEDLIHDCFAHGITLPFVERIVKGLIFRCLPQNSISIGIKLA